MKHNVRDPQGRVHACTSCQVCHAVCPVGAIEIELDVLGFYRPVVDDARCTECGLCLKSCYMYDSQVVMSKTEAAGQTHAAFARDPDLLARTSSGGISPLLMASSLTQGATIVGVAYDCDSDRAIGLSAHERDGIEPFNGSKYMQSYSAPVFRQLIRSGRQETYAVFGTPCQIYALDRWARHAHCRENLLLVDIFCHGCPSLLLWQKYIADVKKKASTNRLDAVQFRSKARGWHAFSHAFTSRGRVTLSGKTIDDPFFSLFFEDVVLNEACADCQARSTLHYTDIRLGDYWGDRFDDNTTGMSAVVACSQAGRDALDRIASEIERVPADFSDVIRAQSYGKSYAVRQAERDFAFQLLKSDLDIHTVFRRYIRQKPAKKRLIRTAKRLAGSLPDSLVRQIRRGFHRMRN